jgi:hypothetical protein
MKQFLLSVFSIASLTVFSQISDLPVNANPAIICNGESSTITITGSETQVKYTLRNSSNSIIDGPIAGSGSDITLNTGALTTTETFNVYAEDDYNALSFNGINQAVNLGAINRGIDANGVSIAMWVKTTDTPSTESFFASKYISTRGFIMSMDSNGKLIFKGKWTNGTFGSSGPSSTSVNDGNWHYIVGTSDGATWTTYVDGVLESSATTGTPGNLALSNYIDFWLGTYNSGGYYLGEMDDIAIWKTVLTPTEVSSYYTTCLSGTEPNLIGLYHCDESQTTIVDDSPEAIDGVISATLTNQGITPCTPSTSSPPIQMTQTATIQVVTINDESLSAPANVCNNESAMVTIGSSSVGAYYSLLNEENIIIDGPYAGTGSGISFNTGAISSTKTFGVFSTIDTNTTISSSLDFDGINDYVDLSTHHRFVNSEVTVACWVKTTPNASSQFIVSKYDVNSGFYMLIHPNGKASFDVKGLGTAGNQSGQSTTSVDDNEWHYIVGTGSIGGTSKIYIDGVLESSSATTFGGSTLQNTASLKIGSYASNYAKANIDDFAIWRIELSPATILANMTNCVDVSSPDLTGYYLMNTGIGAAIMDRSAMSIHAPMVNMDPVTSWLNGVANGCLIFNDCSSVMTQKTTISVDNDGPIPNVGTLTDVTGQCEVTSLVAPTASDLCSGTITGTHNATFPITTSTAITWTYDDDEGNLTTQDQQVNISDTQAPIADTIALSTITELCEVLALTPPTATDNCIGQVIGTHNVTLPIIANTLVTWTYDDGSGNISTQDQQVNINTIDASVTVSGITITANNTTADSYQWVDCNNGNAPISGATSHTLTPTTNGSYAVEITIGNCTETSGCEIISTVGIDEQLEIELSVYPNPANIFMNISTVAKIQHVVIYDVAGAIVQTETKERFSVQELVTGVYFLTIKTDLGIVRKQFVKN